MRQSDALPGTTDLGRGALVAFHPAAWPAEEAARLLRALQVGLFSAMHYFAWPRAACPACQVWVVATHRYTSSSIVERPVSMQSEFDDTSGQLNY